MGTFTNDVIAVQNWWLKEIKDLTRKVMAEEEKRQQRQKSQSEKQLGEYRSYADIQDAYGVGAITERKRDKLMEMLEKREQADWSDRQYEMKLDLLHEMYETANQVIADQEGKT